MSAPCRACGHDASRHTFPGGGRAVCPDVKLRRTIVITTKHVVDLPVETMQRADQFTLTNEQQSQAVALAGVDPDRVESVRVLCTQGVK